MSKARQRNGSAVVEWGLALVIVLLFAGAMLGADHADAPQSEYRALMSEFMRGKSASIAAANPAPAATVTTAAAYTEGVRFISFLNPGSRVVYITTDGTVATDTNYNLILPNSAGFSLKQQQYTTRVSAYAAGSNTIYVSW